MVEALRVLLWRSSDLYEGDNPASSLRYPKRNILWCVVGRDVLEDRWGSGTKMEKRASMADSSRKVSWCVLNNEKKHYYLWFSFKEHSSTVLTHEIRANVSKLILPCVFRCEEMLMFKGMGPETFMAPGLLAREQPGIPTLTSEYFQPLRYLVFALNLL